MTVLPLVSVTEGSRHCKSLECRLSNDMTIYLLNDLMICFIKSWPIVFDQFLLNVNELAAHALALVAYFIACILAICLVNGHL